jgi:hypothetical protein
VQSGQRQSVQREGAEGVCSIHVSCLASGRRRWRRVLETRFLLSCAVARHDRCRLAMSILSVGIRLVRWGRSENHASKVCMRDFSRIPHFPLCEICRLTSDSDWLSSSFWSNVYDIPRLDMRLEAVKTQRRPMERAHVPESV